MCYVATDNFIANFRIFIWISSHNFKDLTAEGLTFRDNYVIIPLAHDGIVVVAI